MFVLILDDFKRNENENEEQFTWRICEAKSNGVINCSWVDVADTINSIFREKDNYWNESAYRKPYQNAKKYFCSGVFENHDDDLKTTLNKLEFEKIKLRDLRNDLRKDIKTKARNEAFIEEMCDLIKENIIPDEKCFEIYNKKSSDNDMIIPLTDLHVGIDIDNYFNTYNKQVFKERLNTYLNKVIEIQERHSSENAYVVLSELISGYIHTELIAETNMTMMQQFLTAIKYIKSFIISLSKYFKNVYVYCVAGNHSRVNPNKKKSIKGNNMDMLAIPFLKESLQNYKNIFVCENNIDIYIATFFVRNNFVVASHGDRDKLDSCVKNYTLLLGKQPDIILLGHRHTNSITTEYDTKIIQSGCISGTDEFAVDVRVKNKPEQLVTIVSNNGVECYYEIEF